MNERTKTFQRNERLEELLQELNSLLAPAGVEFIKRYRMPRYPVIFIIGLPRSGTTLLLQWLAQTGLFAYPTNLMARFYAAPAIGAMIQEMLTGSAYNFNNEFFDIAKNLDYQSNLGKTQGTLAPNEFWYFWRRFLPTKELSHLSPAALKQVKGEAFARELAAIEAVFDKPLALKALILQLNLPYLDKLVEKVVFLHIRRHPYFNAQSLLEAREKYYGQRTTWYSIKPPEYSWLKDQDPLTQVAGQVYYYGPVDQPRPARNRSRTVPGRRFGIILHFASWFVFEFR